jgi:hypothetical protein
MESNEKSLMALRTFIAWWKGGGETKENKHVVLVEP